MTLDLTGKKLGPNELLEVLGEGTLGTVYKAYQASEDRWVAVKVLNDDEEETIARFKREAEAIANLLHRNILRVYEYDLETTTPYITMELVEQQTLKTYLQQHQLLNIFDATNLAISLAEALHYAHQRDLVHRNVKTANVLLPHEDWPILTDFGLVKRVADLEPPLTDSGVIMGTPAYISPEQAEGKKVDFRIDMYALGVILFEMIAGRLPFDYENGNVLMLAHMTEPPPSPLDFNAQCPTQLADVILKALAKSPEDRYTDMQEMIDALRHVLAKSTLTLPHQQIDRKSRRESNDQPQTDLPNSDVAQSQARLLIPHKNIAIHLSQFGANNLTLGRTFGEAQVDIDLTPHGAAEAGLSRLHARLSEQGDEWYITDLGSTNGTYVNETRLPPGESHLLKNGDKVHCSQMKLIFLVIS